MPCPGPRPGVNCAVVDGGCAVDEDRFEGGVVGEPLDVPQVWDGPRHGGVQRGRAMRGNLQVVRGRQCSAAEPPGVPAAAGGVQLQAIHHRTQPDRVVAIGGVLPGRDIAADG